MDNDINNSAFLNYIDNICCMHKGESTTTLVNLLAILISQGRTTDQLNLIGDFLEALGSSISLIATEQEIWENKKERIEEIENLKKKIRELERKISR